MRKMFAAVFYVFLGFGILVLFEFDYFTDLWTEIPGIIF